jgi:hypothetical protein
MFVEDQQLKATMERLKARAIAEGRKKALASINPFNKFGGDDVDDDNRSQSRSGDALEMVTKNGKEKESETKKDVVIDAKPKQPPAKANESSSMKEEAKNEKDVNELDEQALKRAAEKPKKKKKKVGKQTIGDQLRSIMGEEEDPPNSQWITLERRKGGNKPIPAGEVLISIELLPKVSVPAISFPLFFCIE